MDPATTTVQLPLEVNDKPFIIEVRHKHTNELISKVPNWARLSYPLVDKQERLRFKEWKAENARAVSLKARIIRQISVNLSLFAAAWFFLPIVAQEIVSYISNIQ